MIRLVLLTAGLAALMVAVPAYATEVATAPMLGTELLSGRVRCLAVNVDTKPKLLTRMEMVSTAGAVLASLPAPELVPPGQIRLTTFADLSVASPAYCRFAFQGKFRASLMYLNGTAMEIVPATK
ncbi:MAG: hypothetical protein IT294_16855 [Deltaproteobacteria bacterium]|nr:hypothetical protein [Deltaproteobacteria bacterium]